MSDLYPDAANPAPFRLDLHCQEGSSDKFYNIIISQVADGWRLAVDRGRRGRSLIHDVKTPESVSYEVACKKAISLINEKTKEYRPINIERGGVNAPVTFTRSSDSGIRLALLAVATEADLNDAVHDPFKALEEKENGDRLCVYCRDGKLTGVNKKGQTRAIPTHAAEALRTDVDYTVDGEIMESDYRLYDIMDLDGRDIRGLAFAERKQHLKAAVSVVSKDRSVVYAVETATTPEAKMALIERVRAANREGVVIKDTLASYEAGRNRNGLKFKFWHTLSAIVLGQSKDRRSVRLGLLDGDTLVDVGAVTVPSNQEIPQEGTIVEVRYQEANPSGSLIVPSLLGPRSDVDRSECVLEQRVFSQAA